MSFSFVLAATLALIVPTALIARSDAEVLQVQILHRHGAREHLSKDAAAPGKENGAALIEAGTKQLRELGQILRKRYLQAGAVHEVGGANTRFKSAYDFESVSTNFDRTLSSARALLQGLYPNVTVPIPTKVFSSKENDFRLRGYTICPTFSKRVLDFTKSKQFLDRERKHKPFLTRVAGIVDEKPDLANVFNIYDHHLLHRLGHVFDKRGILSNADWSTLSELANWAETRRYAGTAGLVGGAQVGEMLGAAQAMMATPAGPHAHRVITYSAHYPTLLGVLAALREPAVPTFPADSIPPFGAALIWELHTGGVLKLLWYTGDPNKALRPLALPIAGCTDADAGCPLERIARALARGRADPAPATFCARCGTDPRTTPVCAPGVVLGQVSDATPHASRARAGASCGVRRARTTGGAIGGAVGLAVGVAVMLCLGRIQMHRDEARERRMQMHMQDIVERAERPLENIPAEERSKSSSLSLDRYMD